MSYGQGDQSANPSGNSESKPNARRRRFGACSPLKARKTEEATSQPNTRESVVETLLPIKNLVSAVSDVKQWLGTLENIHDHLSNLGVLDGTRGVRDLVPCRSVEACSDDLVSITNNGEIGIVGNYYDLPSLFSLPNRGNKHPRHSLVVQILLGLIDNERYISLVN